jgi:hypothetical protein
LLLPRRSRRFSVPFSAPLAAARELIVPSCLAVALDFVPVADRVAELPVRVPVDRAVELPERVAELPVRVALPERVVVDRAAVADRAVVDRVVVVRLAGRVGAAPPTGIDTPVAPAGTGGVQLRNMIAC